MRQEHAEYYITAGYSDWLSTRGLAGSERGCWYRYFNYLKRERPELLNIQHDDVELWELFESWESNCEVT